NQTVTVTGENDDQADGNQSYTVSFVAADSDDAGYDGLVGATVSITNLDDETPGISVQPRLGLVTTEGGGTAQFQVVLNSEPFDTVTIELAGDPAEGSLSTSSLE